MSSEFTMPNGSGLTVSDDFGQYQNTIRRIGNADVIRGVGDRTVETSRLQYNHKKNGGVFEFTRLGDDFLLFLSDCEPPTPIEFKFEGEDWIRFHFRVSGQSVMLYGNEVKTSELDGAFASVFFHPQGKDCGEWLGFDDRLSFVTLWCKRRYLTHSLDYDATNLAPEFRQLIEYESKQFFFEKVPLSAEMIRIVNELVHDGHLPSTRPLFLKAKALELVCEILEQMHVQSGIFAEQDKLSMREMSAINDAHEILQASHLDPPSIAELSKLVGLNRDKLCWAFKSQFGQTINDYCRELTMESAWQTIKYTDKPLNVVSWESGYTHTSNFVTAFRKYFGVTPKQVRRLDR